MHHSIVGAETWLPPLKTGQSQRCKLLSDFCMSKAALQQKFLSKLLPPMARSQGPLITNIVVEVFVQFRTVGLVHIQGICF